MTNRSIYSLALIATLTAATLVQAGHADTLPSKSAQTSLATHRGAPDNSVMISNYQGFARSPAPMQTMHRVQ